MRLIVCLCIVHANPKNVRICISIKLAKIGVINGMIKRCAAVLKFVKLAIVAKSNLLEALCVTPSKAQNYRPYATVQHRTGNFKRACWNRL
jgi:hypothetical protein